MAEVPNSTKEDAAREFDRQQPKPEPKERSADVIDLQEERDKKLDNNIVDKLGDAQDLREELLKNIQEIEDKGKNTDELKAKLDDVNSNIQTLEAKYDERGLGDKLKLERGEVSGDDLRREEEERRTLEGATEEDEEILR